MLHPRVRQKMSVLAPGVVKNFDVKIPQSSQGGGGSLISELVENIINQLQVHLPPCFARVILRVVINVM